MDLTMKNKMKKLMPYWHRHQGDHILEVKKWIKIAETEGLEAVAADLRRANEFAELTKQQFEAALAKLKTDKPEPRRPADGKQADDDVKGQRHVDIGEPMAVHFQSIGVIHTPYTDQAPYQPVDDDEGEFRIQLFESYTKGLEQLERFAYIYVLYYIHQVGAPLKMCLNPSWTPDTRVGVFASRSPVRPNRIGLSVVRLKGIEKNMMLTSGLDVFDGTPLLDIKPYISDLDVKSDANYGWLDDIEDRDHLLLHIKGVPHDY